MAVLQPRDRVCYDRFRGYYYNCDSAWDRWARWLVLGLVIAAVLLLFISVSCITARRRRKMGHQPYRGTGWAIGRTPFGHGQPQYNTQQPYYANNEQQQQPPVYNNSNKPAPPPPYASAGDNQGYYAPQQETDLQQPAAVYGGQGQQQTGYMPPPGPPPARH